MKSIWVVLLAALAAPASAAKIEAVRTVTERGGGLPHPRTVGDPRYLALTTLHDDGSDASFEVLDLASTSVIHVATPRAGLAQIAGSGLDGEVVSYAPDRVGIHLTDAILPRAPHHWYAELDPRTGNLGAAVNLGSFDDRAELEIIGADPKRGALWMYTVTYGEHLRPDFSHERGPERLFLQRLDLAKLTLDAVLTIDLPAREMKSGYEDRLMAHHAPDFSHIAIAEYDERAFKTNPPGRIYMIDPEQRTQFSVPALDTTYGVAFSSNGAYAYLASSQLGTIVRVDLAKQKVDRTVSGPRLTHDLVISSDGLKLFVIGSSASYTTFDLPALGNRTSRRHAASVAPGAAQLFGDGMPSADGQFYVLPAPRSKTAPRTERDLVIARFVP